MKREAFEEVDYFEVVFSPKTVTERHHFLRYEF